MAEQYVLHSRPGTPQSWGHLELAAPQPALEYRHTVKGLNPATTAPTATLSAQPLLYTATRVPAITATRAEPIVTEHDISRITDLGLGRGLDATNPTPWLNKSSFQVRPVNIDNIVGTEEGGSLQCYERMIESLYAYQASMKTSITVPQSPVSLGLDTEASRSLSSTRHAIGRKVVNRTVSYRSNFSDAPTSRAQSKVPGVDRIHALSVAPHATTCTRPRDYDTDIPFEERLCSWILERIQQREELRSDSEEDYEVTSSSTGALTIHVSITQPEEGEGSVSASETEEQRPSVEELLTGSCTSVEALAKYIRGSSHDERKEILQDCKDFVSHFHITHYVSAIELGAYEYRVMSETEYYAQIGAAGTFGFQSVATAAVSGKASAKTKKRTSELKTIGTIQPDGTVVRGSYGEAVVGFQMLPISNLVKLHYLRMALQEALVSYINSTEGANTMGPFIIACDNDRLYLTVNQAKDYSVEATKDIKRASKFYIIPSDSSRSYEFLIAYYDERKPGLVEKRNTLTNLGDLTRSVPRYLNSDVSFMGSNPGPLKVEHQVSTRTARLVLSSRLTRVPIETSNWVNGKEIFYINCSRRRLKAKSYLCVKEKRSVQPSLSRSHSLRSALQPKSFSLSRQRRQLKYVTACVSSIKSHNGHNTFMLFRLLSADVLKDIMTPEQQKLYSDSISTLLE